MDDDFVVQKLPVINAAHNGLVVAFACGLLDHTTRIVVSSSANFDKGAIGLELAFKGDLSKLIVLEFLEGPVTKCDTAWLVATGVLKSRRVLVKVGE